MRNFSDPTLIPDPFKAGICTATQRTPLPSWAMDIIAQGIENRSDDRRPIFKALVDVFCSMHRANYTLTDAINASKDGVKTGPGKVSNGLWQQITTRLNGRQVSWDSVKYTIEKAWNYAGAIVAKGGRPQPQRESEILALAQSWEEAISHLELTGTEAKVLKFVARETERRKFLHVTCPAQGTADACGVSRKGAWEALISLRNKGLIICRSRGTWRGDRENHGGRAAIYRLADIADFFRPARGTPTLPLQNRSDQPGSKAITPLIGHMDLLGEQVMSKKDPYRSTELGPEGRHGGHQDGGVFR
jgi:hypothetical protein